MAVVDRAGSCGVGADGTGGGGDSGNSCCDGGGGALGEPGVTIAGNEILAIGMETVWTPEPGRAEWEPLLWKGRARNE